MEGAPIDRVGANIAWGKATGLFFFPLLSLLGNNSMRVGNQTITNLH